MVETVTITLSREAADRLQHGCADMLCWCAGFIAARPEHTESHPMGVEPVRTLRDHLRRALDRAEPREVQS